MAEKWQCGTDGDGGQWYENDPHAGEFVLIIRDDTDGIRALPGDGGSFVFRGFGAAALRAGEWLHAERGVSREDAGQFAMDLSGAGFDAFDGITVTILDAHRTSDGRPILPGMQVTDYDRRPAVVEPRQFFDGGCLYPGGQYFDGWYYTITDGEDRAHGRFNGERLRSRV